MQSISTYLQSGGIGLPSFFSISVIGPNSSLFVGQLDATYMDVADKSQIRTLDKKSEYFKTMFVLLLGY